MVATKEKYTKTSVINDYDFDNMPSSFDENTKEAFKKMDKEKHHRLYIYINSLFDVPVLLEGQNESDISDNILDGKSVVISGVFENYSRNELKNISLVIIPFFIFKRSENLFSSSSLADLNSSIKVISLLFLRFAKLFL